MQEKTNQQTLTLQEQIEIAHEIAKSSIIPDVYKNNPANVLVIIGLGQAMGLSPMESIYRINIINNKPTASGELLETLIKKAGHKLVVTKDEDAQSVTATIIRKDDPQHPYSVTRDLHWAKQMGLTNSIYYQKQPMTMLFWRAVTAAAREACSDALYGVLYTQDEMFDFEIKDNNKQNKSKKISDTALDASAAQKTLGEAMRKAKEFNIKPSAINDYSNKIFGRDITQLNDEECSKLTKIINGRMQAKSN